jgi:hypothetical protein|tara:strand:+ start:23 stop:172 length:150 start_codon:yes stop_codon:yes gene_type:complete
MYDIIMGIVLMFGISMIICIGAILANGTQEHIEYQNAKIRKQIEEDKNA